MRWATYCIYLSYPVGGTAALLVGLLRIAGPDRFSGVLWSLLGITQLAAAWYLHRREAIGWNLNWAVIASGAAATILQGTMNQARRDPADWWFFLLVATIFVTLAFVWPSFVYWQKRRHIFTERAGPFPKQWSWALIVLLLVPIIAAISLPAYQDYLRRKATGPIIGEDNPFDRFDPKYVHPDTTDANGWGAAVAAFDKENCDFVDMPNRGLLTEPMQRIVDQIPNVTNKALLDGAATYVRKSDPHYTRVPGCGG